MKKDWSKRLILVVTALMVIFGAGSATAMNSPLTGESVLVEGDETPGKKSLQFELTSDSSPSMALSSPSSEESLKNQLDNRSTFGIASTKFEASHSAWNIEAADDFTVPSSEGSWSIHRIDVYSFCVDSEENPKDCGALNKATVRFYQNQGGLPGSLVYQEEVDSINTGPLIWYVIREYSFILPVPVELQAGTYWISIQVKKNFSEEVWYWVQREVQDGNDFAHRNPGGAWPEPDVSTTWDDGYGGIPDLTFKLVGERSIPYRSEISTGDVYGVAEHGSQSQVYISIPESNVVKVVDTDTESVLKSISVGSQPKGITISPDSSKVYVAVQGGNAIKVINTANQSVVDSFSLTYSPEEIRYGGPGRLYVSEANGTIHSLDPTSGSEVETLPYTFRAGELLALSPDGETLCSGGTGTTPASIACYDVSTDSPPAPWTKLDVGGNLQTIDISADNAILYTVCGAPYHVKALDLETLNQVGQFNTGAYPQSAYDSALGGKVYISGGDSSWSWNAQTYQTVRNIDRREVEFLGAGRETHTAYATLEDTFIIYHFTSFDDVLWTHWAKDWIESLYQSGLTGGCSADPLLYCPEDAVTRAEMSVFLLKGMNAGTYSPPAPDDSHPFSDINGHWAEGWMEELYDVGLTSGYPDGTYRPQNQVTRAEMAVFLLRAKHGAEYSPPAASGSAFSDVAGHWAEDWIEQLADEGITGGYPDGTYRPNSLVTRAEMAVFLVRTFNISTP